MAQLETVDEAFLESDRYALRVSSGVPDVTARKVVSECSLAPREMRRRARRESANALATAGDLPRTNRSTDSGEKGQRGQLMSCRGKGLSGKGRSRRLSLSWEMGMDGFTAQRRTRADAVWR